MIFLFSLNVYQAMMNRVLTIVVIVRDCPPQKKKT